MIAAIEIEGFKSLERVSLNLGNLNLFIGTNASGKSNFFDALRVLQGIGCGFTIDEIFNGKPKSASSEVWEQIRGGTSKANFARRGDSTPNLEEQVIRFSVNLQFPDKPDIHIQLPKLPDKPDKPDIHIQYSIEISAHLSCIRREKLQINNKLIFDAKQKIDDYSSNHTYLEVTYYPDREPKKIAFIKSTPVLHLLLRFCELSPEQAKQIQNFINILNNIQYLTPSPSILRNYSQASIVARMGERGENFAALIKNISLNEKEKKAFVSWLKELTPNELDDIHILYGAVGDALFALKDGEQIHPATILSDGTLRFSAITAAFFQPDIPNIITIEEIENGIHPTRLRLLVELLKNRSKFGKVQIMATTHSPMILEWLDEEDYKTTFVCSRDEETGATKIVPLSELPHLLDIIQKQPISELFAEGWFEGVL